MPDIHTGSWNGDRATLQKAVDLINAQQTDLIVFTGDIVNTKASELEPFENILAQLKAPDGVFSILGNHDYGPYHNWPTTEAQDQNIRDVQNKQASMGWQLLNNDHVILKRATDSIALIGVENNGEPPFSQYSDLPKAMEGTEQCSFKLLLTLRTDAGKYSTRTSTSCWRVTPTPCNSPSDDFPRPNSCTQNGVGSIWKVNKVCTSTSGWDISD